MSEDPTRDLTDSSTQDLTAVEMLRLVLVDVRNVKADVTDIKARIGALESAGEDRARETRPKLDLIVKEISDVREEMAGVRRELRSIDRKLELFNAELLQAKIDIRDFDKRLTESERSPN